MKNKLLLVDTSIWIDYFRGGEKEANIVEPGLERQNLLITGIILAELIYGVADDKKRMDIQSALGAIQYVECEWQDWTAAGETLADLRKKGVTLPLTDVVLAMVAKRCNAAIATLDRHFQFIPGVQVLP